jgi:hypothetical protein
MSLLNIKSGRVVFKDKTKFTTSSVYSYDSDALNYIASVETADGQTLEEPVKIAYNDFIVGCKDDGIWNALKASCILAGARTLNGALIPLVGTAPSSFNFVSADYNRKTGLKGNGTNKRLNTNRRTNTDPQNSKHTSIYVTERETSTSKTYMGGSDVSGSTIIRLGTTSNGVGFRINSSSRLNLANGNVNKAFLGASRSNATQITFLVPGFTAFAISNSSATPTNEALQVFSSGTSTAFSIARISFYSIGEALDLDKLNTRVSALMTSINGAIA